MYHDMKEGAKMRVSLKEVAEKCGYSQTLVSAVLGGRHDRNRCSVETRKYILDCAQAMGYTPNLLARAMVTGKSPILLLSLHESHCVDEDVVDFYLSDMLIQCARILRVAGMYMLYMPYRSAEEQLAQIREAVDSGMACGVIANFIAGEEEGLIRFFQKHDLPSVLLGIPQEPHGNICVDCDLSYLKEVIKNYADRCGFKCWGQLGINAENYELELLMSSVPDITPLSCPDALFFASGIQCYRKVRLEYPVLKHLVLLEDTRFPLDELCPMIQVRSLHPKVVSIACRILLDWLASGKKPNQETTLISIEKSDIKIKDIGEAGISIPDESLKKPTKLFL